MLMLPSHISFSQAVVSFPLFLSFSGLYHFSSLGLGLRYEQKLFFFFLFLTSLQILCLKFYSFLYFFS
ncbi:hypothetical protein ES332_A07G138300v1 [Gossypium tomentosum]|uniref:Uncharacterized protein n=1 Tax=Gossypium tomentosum TaxID=34277 RepID=A0A5D2PSQ3_GOSTO|nr:hypothetical protein ES332_A07G138300v1 [Gossypium tomentosum]